MNPRVEALLREAAEWRLLSLLFECPGPEWREKVRALGAEVRDPALRTAAEEALAEASEGIHHSILGPGGPAPAREVSYHDTVQLGYLMSELNAFHEAFAFRPRTIEAIDHVSVEAGFAGYLRVKQAFALAEGNTEAAALAEEAAKDFRSQHLVYVAEPLARSLSESGVGYLAKAGQALLARVGPSPVLPVLGNLAGAVGGDAFECGVAG